MNSPTVRRDYGGQTAQERADQRRQQYLDAGLQLLGTVGAAGMTTRAIIAEAGLAPRYFYEAFGTVEALQAAVFQQVVVEVDETSAAMIATAEPDLYSLVRAGVSACVAVLVDDPRKGRVLFVESSASSTLAGLRHAETMRFADKLLNYAAGVLGSPVNDSAEQTARVVAKFAVGGMAEVIAGAVQNPDLDRESLINQITELLLASAQVWTPLIGTLLARSST